MSAHEAEESSRVDQRLMSVVSRWLWTGQRLGLSPGKVLRRIANRAEPKVVCVCIPKAGTHLLERALCLHPRLYRKLIPTLGPRIVGKWGGLVGVGSRLRPGQIVMTHLPYDAAYPPALARMGVRTIFLIRDPRDIAISQTYFVMSKADHWLHETFAERSDFQSRLRLAIEGAPGVGLESAEERLEGFAGWLADADTVVRFEDLIGGVGGGDDVRQMETLTRLYKTIGVQADEALCRSIVERLVSAKSPTFRRGMIGQWRTQIDDESAEVFKRVAGAQITRYGYGGDW
jgi:hypothetical protein